MSPEAQATLAVMRRFGTLEAHLPSIAAGGGLSVAETTEALIELEGEGLVVPITWRLTEEGRA